jgi:hypothetical protein
MNNITLTDDQREKLNRRLRGSSGGVGVATAPGAVRLLSPDLGQVLHSSVSLILPGQGLRSSGHPSMVWPIGRSYL